MKSKSPLPFGLRRLLLVCALTLGSSFAQTSSPATGGPNPTDDGYRGIWFTLGQVQEFGDKYSGGLGTYTANHVPIAIYAKAVNKTFFVYGGSKGGKRYLLNLISYYDHALGTVPRPVFLHDKGCVDDPHDNASLSLDPEGYLWVFISGRARSRPGFIYRSAKPYDITRFDLVSQREITYPQPRWIEGEGWAAVGRLLTEGQGRDRGDRMDAARGEEHDARLPAGRGLEQVHRADEVVLDELSWGRRRACRGPRGCARQHARLGCPVDHPVKGFKGIDIALHPHVAMDDAHSQGSQWLAIGLGADPPQVVERRDAAAGKVRDEPAADAAAHESAAAGDEDVHGVAACRLRSQASTIWSNVSASPILGDQPG
jgi:hypothetical protein